MQSSLGQAKEVPKSKDDLTCDSILTYAEQLELNVDTVYKNIGSLTKKTKGAPRVAGIAGGRRR